ncbi:Gas vesicle synthesis protein GvpL/GvpF [Streptomyces sp. YIM 130001]|uniref:GvpL/GvpF family gas vesicle protein n=1 Tax=Streptomyces sp. YIM 130001 TaxID=2259644 RepID=UPI000E65CBF3|nr:GvpL/GvpF family gas vesicle protein [Streptomyces sp. YIM 130001]RII20407.1 Gas vesicle synthesis protein GvpL/GvpF [Streptomyces sp. YIM 130001]
MNSDDGARDMSYVYAVGRAGEALDRAAALLPGIDGGQVRTVCAGGLAALTSSVPADAFGAEALKTQLEDLGRLEVMARTHHAVVEAAYEHATVLPMRLATVYIEDDRVAAMLDERATEFDILLAQLEGHVELGVKVYADARQAAAQTPVVTQEAPAASPGRAYLQQRRAQRRTHSDVYRAAGAVADQAASRVAEFAVMRMAHRPQQGELAPDVGDNIANEAFLVPVGRVEDFRTALAGLVDDVPGVRLEVTGPWAPYSFATPPAPVGEP